MPFASATMHFASATYMRSKMTIKNGILETYNQYCILHDWECRQSVQTRNIVTKNKLTLSVNYIFSLPHITLQIRLPCTEVF